MAELEEYFFVKERSEGAPISQEENISCKFRSNAGETPVTY
jgi:hypothetical protein